MRLLYVAPKYDYGQRERGLGFEHHNFYHALVGMGFDVTYFDYPTLFQELGRRAMNQRLWEQVQEHRPDLLFGVVRNDLIDPRVMRRISALDHTTTINWYCDDHWQFDSQARRWTPHFNHVVTTSQTALANYRNAGFTNVIKSQWACNHRLYQRQDLPLEHAVTFVGQCYGQRKEAINTLRNAGIDVQCWGRGWPNGGISQEQMIRVFNTSRINLNFADASAAKRTKLDNLVAGRAMQSLKTKPVIWRAWAWSHRAAVALNQRHAQSTSQTPQQIKGRVFEVTGCGGFLLTQQAENLHEYLSDGKHLASFHDSTDLIDKVRYYLAHEDECQRIAQAGHHRVLSEHTYERRFEEIFRQVGIALPRIKQHAA